MDQESYILKDELSRFTLPQPKRGGRLRLGITAKIMNLDPIYAQYVVRGLLIFAAWGDPGFRVRRPLVAAGLAWLLACFWLTPSFIATVAFNWPAVKFET